MILGRLRVRGKLNLLLLLPLAAVTLIAIPFVAGQVENARAATTTADAAGNARQLGALVWELQRERLLTAVYLASPNGDDIGVMKQQQMVADTAEAVRDSLGPDASEELVKALARLGSLADLRAGALERGVSLDSVARTYHAVIEAVIDALRLVPQRTSDAEGTRQLTALDALLRANEQSSLRGMAVIAAAASPDTGLRLLADSSAQAQMLTERFVQQANVDQAGLVVLVDQGEAARRVEELVKTAPEPHRQGQVAAFVADALAGVESQSTLRRLVQDRVTREISEAAAARAGSARSAAWTVGVGAAVLFVLVMVLVVSVSRSIAHPLQRLTRAAGKVADLANAELMRVSDVERVEEQRPPRLAAIDVTSGDEVGELATAFNRVQATAAMLLERQMVTRRNVSMMFANVAQRTQSLVSRQLSLVDELERNEQNAQLLAKLYRLDHLSTRLGRNAKNLLVVAGARDGGRLAAPSSLATALRTALAEIEDYQRVHFGSVGEIMISSELVSDLVLVFAELLENATAFSPPESQVDVQSELFFDGWCQVSIIDRGIGMRPDQLSEENRRLVERERLDIAPTSVLGLFVVGRLARRHGLDIRLSPTPGGGVTATVGIPSVLITPGTAAVEASSVVLPTPLPPIPRALAPAASIEATPGDAASAEKVYEPLPRPAAPWPSVLTPPASNDDGFSWFSPAGEISADLVRDTGTATHPEDRPYGRAAAPPQDRSTLNRRVPGQQLPATSPRPTDPAPVRPAVQDPAAARVAMDAYQTAIARAALPSEPATTASPSKSPAPTARGEATVTFRGRASLPRRVPGAHLAPSLRHIPAAAPPQPDPASPTRDPESERAAFDAFAEAMAISETSPARQDI